MRLLIAIHAALLRLRDRIAPLGYQDEHGFHYGLPPMETESEVAP